MVDLIFPLDPSQESPLPKDDGVVSAAIAVKAAEESKSARDLSVQKAGEVLSGVNNAAGYAEFAKTQADAATAMALQVSGAIGTVLSKADDVALAATAVNNDKVVVLACKEAVAADRASTQLDRQLAQSLVGSFQRTWLGAFVADDAANAYRLENGIPLADGLQYFNTTIDKTRQWKNTVWEDYDATAQQSQTNAGLSAALAGMHAAAAEQYRNTSLILSEQITQNKNYIDTIRADLYAIHLGELNSDAAANNVWTAGGNQLVDGLRYYNVVTNKFRVRSGSAWGDEILPGVSAAAAAFSATSSESARLGAVTAREAAEAAAAQAATTTIAGAKIASLTASALRSIAVIAGKSVELLGLNRVNDFGSGSFIGAVAAQFNGSLSYNTSSGTNTIRLLTVTGLSAGAIYIGMLLSYGSNITVLKQISGVPGGDGTYAVKTTAGQVDTVSIAMTAKFVDDGGLYIVPNNANGSAGDGSTAWIRQVDFSMPVSAGWWGVKANFTDYDHAAAQKAVDFMSPIGGHLIFPPGKMRFGSQVSINRTTGGAYPTSGGVQYEFVGTRLLKISGFGCEVHVDGNIAGFKTTYQSSYTQLMIEGFTFHNQNNTAAKAGIWAVDTRNLELFMNTFYASAKVPSTFHNILFEGECTLSDIDSCLFGNFGSQDGAAPVNIGLYNIQNGIRVTRCKLGAARKHILASNAPGQTYVPNAVMVTHNAFEGGATFNLTNAIITNDVLTVVGTPSIPLAGGQGISGTGVIAETTILSQLTSTAAGGALGGAGTYQISKTHTGAITASSGTPFVVDELMVAFVLNCDHNIGATRYMSSGCVFAFNRLEKLHAAISIEGTANAVQVPLTTGFNHNITSCVNWIKNPNNIPVNDQDSSQIGTPIGPMSLWNNHGFEWGATTGAPVVLTNASISGDILTVGAGSNVQSNMLASGTGVIAETRILWQISGIAFGPGNYKLSNSHATPVTASAASPITLEYGDPFVYRFSQLNRGIIGRLISSNPAINNTAVYQHLNVQHKAIGTTLSSGDLGTIFGSGSSTRLMKLRGINGLSSGHQIPYNFTGSVTFAAERAKNVRFPTVQSTGPTRFFGSIAGNILTSSLGTMIAGIAVSGDGFYATLNSTGTAQGATPETYYYTLSETFSGSGVYINNITGDNVSRSWQEMYYNQLTEVDGLYSVFLEYGGAIELDRPLRVTNKSNVGFTIDAGTGAFNYVLAVSGITTDPVVGAIYRTNSYQLNLSGLTTAPTVGAVYQVGGVNYTVGATSISGATGKVQVFGPSAPPSTGTLTKQNGIGDTSVAFIADAVSFPVSYTVTNVSLSGASGARSGTIQLSGHSDPPSSGSLTRLNGTGDNTIAFSAAYAGFTFNVSGISIAPAINAVYTLGGVSYTVRSTSLTNSPAANFYGTIHASAPLGTVPSATSGSLSRSSGTGDSSVAFSAVTNLEIRITGPVRWMLVKTPT